MLQFKVPGSCQCLLLSINRGLRRLISFIAFIYKHQQPLNLRRRASKPSVWSDRKRLVLRAHAWKLHAESWLPLHCPRLAAAHRLHSRRRSLCVQFRTFRVSSPPPRRQAAALFSLAMSLVESARYFRSHRLFLMAAAGSPHVQPGCRACDVRYRINKLPLHVFKTLYIKDFVKSFGCHEVINSVLFKRCVS